MINFDAFSHGQIKSKIWLCDNLEKHIHPQATVTILASWYNVLGFMMQVRKPEHYKWIHGVEIDAEAAAIADRICDTWTLGDQMLNIGDDVNSGNYLQSDVVINCSPEHIESSRWFDRIQKGTLVCIQTSNMTDPNEPWLIKTPCVSLRDFKDKYPLKNTYFSDTLEIRYDGWGYDRYMLIGIK